MVDIAALSTHKRAMRGNVRIFKPTQQCQYCGSFYGGPGDCAPTTCKACGTKQCMGNGLARGTCSYCYYGLLPDWSGADGRQCGYSGCEAPAVARGVPRVKFVCAGHVDRIPKAASAIRSASEAYRQALINYA
jgi:hypothetical protein